VVDFTHVIAGPFCAQILGDLGASIIKIEGVEHGDVGRDMAPRKNGQSHYFVAFNRNKRSIALDLKSAGGKAAATELIRNADVVLENFAPGVIDRLGFGYAAVKVLNPAVVFCSISGFGQTGPLSDKRSMDMVAQAYSGMMSTNGTADGPPLKIGVPVGDTSASLFAAMGVLAALYRRRDTGLGEYLDIGMYDCLLPLLANYGGHVLATGTQPERTGSGHYFTVPYGAFAAADQDIVIAVMTNANWLRLCETLGLDQLAADPRFRTLEGRAECREEIYAVLRPELKRHTVADLIERLGAADVACAPVNDIAAALDHPHTAARKMRLQMQHPAYGALEATSLPFGALMRKEHAAPPLHGEHTMEILQEIGMSPAAIDALLTSRGALQGDAPAATAPSRAAR
jgi:formyl-CoA transferase/CoA:oxalate CoA-transferase